MELVIPQSVKYGPLAWLKVPYAFACCLRYNLVPTKAFAIVVSELTSLGLLETTVNSSATMLTGMHSQRGFQAGRSGRVR